MSTESLGGGWKPTDLGQPQAGALRQSAFSTELGRHPTLHSHSRLHQVSVTLKSLGLEQLPQLRVFQSLGRTGIHAVDPALDLLSGRNVMAGRRTDLDLEPSAWAEPSIHPPFFILARRPRAAWSSQDIGQVLTSMGSVMVDIQALQEAVDTEIPAVGSGPPR